MSKQRIRNLKLGIKDHENYIKQSVKYTAHLKRMLKKKQSELERLTHD